MDRHTNTKDVATKSKTVQTEATQPNPQNGLENAGSATPIIFLTKDPASIAGKWWAINSGQRPKAIPPCASGCREENHEDKI